MITQPENLCPEFDEPQSNNAALLPCPTAVMIDHLGVSAVVIARSTADSNCYLVTWFDTHFWRVRRRWFARERLTPLSVQTYDAPLEGAA